MHDLLLTRQEVCLELKIHENTLYRYIARGWLKALKMGGEWRIRRSELDRFLARCEVNHG